MSAPGTTRNFAAELTQRRARSPSNRPRLIANRPLLRSALSSVAACAGTPARASNRSANQPRSSIQKSSLSEFSARAASRAQGAFPYLVDVGLVQDARRTIDTAAAEAGAPDSPVLIRIASSIVETKIFPSPMRPVCAARLIDSMALSAM